MLLVKMFLVDLKWDEQLKIKKLKSHLRVEEASE